MLIKVRGFRGCERADINLAPHALVAGKNFQGKSSLCQAVAAALTQEPLPYFRPGRPDKPILTKTEGKELVRGGVKKGGVQVYGEDGAQIVASVVWPDLVVEGNGSAECSKVACGLLNPMEFEDAHRQKFFSWLLQAEPTDEDAAVAFTDAGIPEAVASAIWKGVSLQGIDVTYRTAKEDGAKLKGRWEQASGESFGSKKAEGWVPQGWRPELADVTEEELASQCLNARKLAQAVAAAQAVGADEVVRLRQSVMDEQAMIQAHAAASKILDEATLDLTDGKRLFESIVVPTAVPCPSCGTALDIHDGGVLKLSQASFDDIDTAKEAKAEAGEIVKVRQDLADKARNAVNEYLGRCRELKGSQDKLDAAMKRKGTQQAVEDAQDALRSLEADYVNLKAREVCKSLTHQIAANQKIVDILAPEGLRRQKLVKALANFNNGIAKLCASAYFPTMTLTDELEIQYGGRRYWLLSESEKYRVRCVVQTIVALYDTSPVVILDGADILDAEGRAGLMQMLGDERVLENLKVLVAMTMRDRRDLPVLADFEMGHSYWMDAGVANVHDGAVKHEVH